MASSGYLGGNVSMAEKRKMIAKYLHPLASFVNVRWRGRYYCPTCGRWVRTVAV